jgi:ParB/RepB/Spo0J family partition protein
MPATAEPPAKTGEGESPRIVENMAELMPRMIPVAQIKPLKSNANDPSVQVFRKKTAQEIADSIGATGLLYPIVLRKLDEPEGNCLYEIVVGNHRFFACAKILGWDEIPAHVRTLNDKECQLWRCIENSCRNVQAKARYFAQLALWRKLHLEANPIGKAGGKALTKRRFEEGTVGVDPTGNRMDEPPRATLKEMIAHSTGTSTRTADRDLRLAKAFDNLTPEQRVVVFPDETNPGAKAHTQQELEELAKAPMPVRDAAVKLMGSGMLTTAALSTARKMITDPTKKSIDAMTDDEYLQYTCGPRLAQLKKVDVFKSDAILYRKFVKLRRKIAKEVEALLRHVLEVGKRGPAQLAIERAFRVKHPNEWLICMQCGSTGKIGGDHCRRCMGAGYMVTYEPL